MLRASSKHFYVLSSYFKPPSIFFTFPLSFILRPCILVMLLIGPFSLLLFILQCHLCPSLDSLTSKSHVFPNSPSSPLPGRKRLHPKWYFKHRPIITSVFLCLRHIYLDALLTALELYIWNLLFCPWIGISVNRANSINQITQI